MSPPEQDRPQGADAEVRVIVVSYNSAEATATLLRSLPAAVSRPHEVVVVENGTQPPQLPAGVRVLRPGRNLGYGRAANLAARDAGAPFLLVANPDVVCAEGSVDELLGAARRWPDAGAFGPAILTPDGRLYPSARALPSLGRGLGHALFGWWWPANPWTAAYRRERGTPHEGQAGWLSGSFLLVRRSAFEEVGGFDEGYFMYVEDLDLCERLGAAGRGCVYVPGAVVTHEGGHATRTRPGPMLRAHHASMYRYLSRRYPLLRPAFWLGLGLRYLLARAVGRVGSGGAPTRDASVLER